MLSLQQESRLQTSNDTSALGDKQLSMVSMRAETMSPGDEVDDAPASTGSTHKDRLRLNTGMTKELRLRDGCKNLLRAISKCPKNAPRRNELKGQLHRIQKNISKMHKRLQKINWASSRETSAPASSYGLIAIAKKETMPLDLATNLCSFVEMHYHEQPAKFQAEINQLQACREAMRKAAPDAAGKASILMYHAYLQQAEHRFFQEDKCLETVFTWYDVFEGHPVTKKSLKLEKASVLFNVAALSSQIALAADCNTDEGLATAVAELESAAGVLQYIREDSALKNSIGTDLARSSLSTLSTMMLAQAQECIWHAGLKKGKAADPNWQPCGAEAAAVSEWYTSVRESFRQPLSSSVPRQWLDMVCLKEIYFRAIADWYSGLDDMSSASKMKKVAGIAKVYRASITLKSCLAKWEKQLPSEHDFRDIIVEHVSLTDQVLSHISDEILGGIRSKMDQMPTVTGKAVRWSTTNCDDLIASRGDDLFHRLGPVYFFNSMCALVERRSHTIVYSDTDSVGFGFSLSGGNPVRVSDVVYDGPACKAGILAGDYIIEVGNVDVRCMVTGQIEEVLNQHASHGSNVTISVVVNYDMQNFEELINPDIPQSATANNDGLPMPGLWAPTRQIGTFKINGHGPMMLECET